MVELPVTLRRLDHLAEHLSRDAGVQAVLGLGSAGVETGRFDEHSDIDFFLVVDDAETKSRYLAQPAWLGGFGGQVAYSFVNDRNGRKALFDDGLFVEYAIFTPPELASLPFAGARVVWSRPAFVLPPTNRPPVASIDTVEFHVNEALTNLYVGLHRHLRGEDLTAMRFIQVYAVDRILALVRLSPTTVLDQPDPFEATRRIESAQPAAALPLADMVPGYAHNVHAARRTLAWLTEHYETHPAIVAAIRQLIGSGRP
jgi:hypothetical protein